jgi:hypothetical protein
MRLSRPEFCFGVNVFLKLSGLKTGASETFCKKSAISGAYLGAGKDERADQHDGLKQD